MKKDKEPVDKRSKMTDRKKYMSRSLHTVRIVSRVAIDIAKREEITAPTEAVRRALRFLEIPDHYDAEVDETMAKCVELTRKGMSR